MELGKTNRLTINRHTDFGYFLKDEDYNEVLLPNAYVTDEMTIGEEINVFLYLDSEERLIATTLKPYAEIDELMQGNDLLVLARYMQILDEAFVEKWEMKVINIHHSFLPAFVGANPYKQAHVNGVKLIKN